MAKTLIQVQQQIEELQQVAARMRQVEIEGVVARIREAIAAYDLDPADLFGAVKSGKRAGRAAVAGARRVSGSTSKSKSKSKLGTGAQYADGTGNEWVGRGPRPKWLRQAIAEGKSLADFAVASGPAGKAPSAPRAARGTAQKKRVVAVKYRSGTDTWTGRGSKPRWVREAIEQGKNLQDFQV